MIINFFVQVGHSWRELTGPIVQHEVEDVMLFGTSIATGAMFGGTEIKLGSLCVSGLVPQNLLASTYMCVHVNYCAYMYICVYMCA